MTDQTAQDDFVKFAKKAPFAGMFKNAASLYIPVKNSVYEPEHVNNFNTFLVFYTEKVAKANVLCFFYI